MPGGRRSARGFGWHCASYVRFPSMHQIPSEASRSTMSENIRISPEASLQGGRPIPRDGSDCVRFMVVSGFLGAGKTTTMIALA